MTNNKTTQLLKTAKYLQYYNVPNFLNEDKVIAVHETVPNRQKM